MSEERNEWNAYNHLESIRKAADALETIHVYELNNRAYGSSKEDELQAQVVDLEKKILEYELQLAELQKYTDGIEETNKILLSANNKLIEMNKLSEENRNLTEDQAEKIIQAYNKLPRVVKKFYGVE